MIKRIIALLLFCIVLNSPIDAQTNASREDLQKQEQSLRKELDELNRLLEQTKKNKKSSLGQLAVIRSKIAKREALVNGIRNQVKILDAAIYNNQLDVQRLNKDLDTLKSRYAKSIIFSYKGRSGYEYLNFLFSAKSFNDAVKRITYLKSYRQNREAQANAINMSQNDLNQKINILSNNKKDRLKTLSVQNEQLQVLEQDKKEQDKVVKQLKSKEAEITAQVKQKESQRRKMQQALTALIKREIQEAERREKDRLAKAKAANAEATNKAKASDNNSTAKANIKIGKVEGGLSSTTDNRPYSALETTEEGRETSISFENNRGNLPWPVDRGNVYVHFGVENIPGTKLNRKSDGIEIALPKGSPVKSVANGTVIYVGDVNGDLSIFVKHGKYFTTYSHLSTASVKVMQEVRAGTVLGRSGVNLDGEGALLFSINNEKVVFFDPESWLKNRR
ncbi:MAG: murein hydrolase activator EnvC family protein [Chitinophagaceae bacterium]|jgi:septal ring factor EnvC (AmiA/AmiB activator)|nr:peptidoglycan DD-metalloendopeptidase family protein [Sediminibacterium sp.]